METNHSRRGFFVQLASLAGAALVVPGLFGMLSSASAQERRRGGGAAKPTSEADFPLVSPTDGPAVAVNYVEDHKKVTKAELKVDRQGVKFESQHCANCGFYKKVGQKDGKEVGTCQIFPQKLVHSTAWCSTWNKKA